MGAFAADKVVLLPFPFTDLTRSKLRPALLLADTGRDDWIARQITSDPYADSHAILLELEDFTSGGLQRASYARPGRLFTEEHFPIFSAAGLISQGRLDEVRNALIAIIHG